MNFKKKLFFGITVIFIVIILFVPFLPVTEEISSQTYLVERHDYAVTTLIVKKGWTLSLSYTSGCEQYANQECEGDVYPTIKILGPDKSIVWEQSGTSESELTLLSELGGNYSIYLHNTETFWYNTITITVNAYQTGKVTIIEYFLYFFLGVGLKIKY
jgi:hypothetical protein